MSHRLERDVRLLKTYAVFSTCLTGALVLAAFMPRSRARERFDEIDVGRINVIEPDGKYRMVISNRARSVGPLYKGKPFLYTGTERPRPGIIFFNDEGTE